MTMDIQITPYHDPVFILVPRDAVKDQRHRLVKFAGWMAADGRPWHMPDLEAYRDTLLPSYAPRTVAAHLSTVRSRYADLVRDRDLFYAIAAQRTDDPLERKAIADEIITRIKNATDPKAAPVATVIIQDVADRGHLRLTSAQASALMAAPGVDTLLGLRDTVLLATLLCTGIREAELCALDVGDLRQHLGGELALLVRKGKGCKQRLVPYGELDWTLAVLDKWTAAAGIEGGAVFRGFYKGGQRLRLERLKMRQVQKILRGYPVMVKGHLTAVRPHDCRRTYARLMYDAGTDPLAIQQNLGHSDLSTTLGYIGKLDAARRRPKAIYTFDLGLLASVPVQVALQ